MNDSGISTAGDTDHSEAKSGGLGGKRSSVFRVIPSKLSALAGSLLKTAPLMTIGSVEPATPV